MTTQHTPGPWQINHRAPDQICDADGEVRGCAPIAIVCGSISERKANAALIVRAPEMAVPGASLPRCASIGHVVATAFRKCATGQCYCSSAADA